AFELVLDSAMFLDQDAGEVLAYSASRADGLALPDWLVFDALARTFSGTPTAADAGTIDVRVSATDLSGAAASDDFGITVRGAEPTGVRLVGTERAEILVGTVYDDVLEGRGGADLLIGLAGSDHLDGGTENDFLLGGGGDDAYLFERGAGHDLIVEGGGEDVLGFGGGIGKHEVEVLRRHGDLVLKVGGDGGGSVTIRNWFNAESKRVERIEFADGSAWSETELRTQASRKTLRAWWHQGWRNDCNDDRHGWFDPRGQQYSSTSDASAPADESRDARRAIAAGLAREARFDFNAAADFLRRDGERHIGAIARDRIAQQWRAVQIGAAFVDYSDDGVSILPRPLALGSISSSYAAGWGYSSSMGRRSAFAGMQAFTGLNEGFDKLD
ncbi:MAG: putative Ig domain-containing protein, partial [Geminicoccales bacterium]